MSSNLGKPNIPTYFINESHFVERVSPTELDHILAAGWRHFGNYFFKYNLGFYQNDIRLVTPLRIDLKNFTFSKSQRRNLKRNADLHLRFAPLQITSDSIELFELHKLRFADNIPESVSDFVPLKIELSPTKTEQLSVYLDNDLIAESFFDVGEKSSSGIYAMFDPAYAKRGLGVFTLLKEIQMALDKGMDHYYLGYVYDGNSFYDYKKRFRSTEAFDWEGNWVRYLND